MESLYEIALDGVEPTVVTASALVEAWRENAPEGVARTAKEFASATVAKTVSELCTPK